MVTPPGRACVLNRRWSPSGTAGMLNQQAAELWPAQLHCRGLARPKECVLNLVIQLRGPESVAVEPHTFELPGPRTTSSARPLRRKPCVPPPAGSYRPTDEPASSKRAPPAENQIVPSAAVVMPPSAGRP